MWTCDHVTNAMPGVTPLHTSSTLATVMLNVVTVIQYKDNTNGQRSSVHRFALKHVYNSDLH